MGESSSSSSPPTTAKADSDRGPRPGPLDGLGEALANSPTHARQVWKFRLRPDDDDEPQ